MNSTRIHILGGVAALAGCSSFGDIATDERESLLQPAVAAPDSVTVEVYWARRAGDTDDFNRQLWAGVQEDRLPVAMRTRLAQHGLRAGVVGGNPSLQVNQLLGHDDVASAPSKSSSDQASPLLTDSAITRRTIPLRPHKPNDIQVTDQAETMSLLFHDGDGVSGETFPLADGVYVLELDRVVGDEARLRLRPEVRYGRPRMQYRPLGPGAMTHQLSKQRHLFGDLELTFDLSPGEMLVLTCQPGASRSLGGELHQVTGDSGPEQKFLLIRLAQRPRAEFVADRGQTWPWR